MIYNFLRLVSTVQNPSGIHDGIHDTEYLSYVQETQHLFLVSMIHTIYDWITSLIYVLYIPSDQISPI